MTTHRLSSAVLFLVFNRPETTRQVFEAIRKAGPSRLYIAADGPRESVRGEHEKVAAVRNHIIKNIDWNCELQTLFRETNMGCRKAVQEAISWFFDHETEGIVLEDDCLPVADFFRFCEWGLTEYRDNRTVGMISGSNLIDYLCNSSFRNGFSNYVSVWGWATWKDRWSGYDGSISFLDIKKLDLQLKAEKPLSCLERLFWRNVFKHTVAFPTTWDFYLQFQFFKDNLLTVYPNRNLIKNLGFGADATHTSVSTPNYWQRSLPRADADIMALPVCSNIAPDRERDRLLAATIWHCTPWGTFRLSTMNLIRYLRV